MRKLSAIEHMFDGNIVFIVTLEGYFTPERLCLALRQVQHKHPVLRSVICEQEDGLYYQEDVKQDISLRIISRLTDQDGQRECQAELTTPFAYGQLQLRMVWLRAAQVSDLLFTSSHRICDGMSMLTIIREVLRLLYIDEPLIPYEAVTTRHMIGDYQPRQPWKQKLKAQVLNGALRLIPISYSKSENNEYYLEWGWDESFTAALKQRCKKEGTSIHAALLVALDRSLFTVLGRKKLPAWIESPMDARRGRLAHLKSDMLFFGGGSFKIHTGEQREETFWARVRAINQDIRKKIDQELCNMPGRYYFNELLKPVANARIQTMVRIGDFLNVNGSWNRFALSNLGNIKIMDDEAPFHLKDLRLYVHSFNFRLLGLVTYTLHGKMRFYYAGDEKCLSRAQADTLSYAFTDLLQRELV